MPIDPNNPVVALCAAGMTCDGGPAEARSLFEEAWNARRDDYDPAIADRAAESLSSLSADGYRAFVAQGINRLQAKLVGIEI